MAVRDDGRVLLEMMAQGPTAARLVATGTHRAFHLAGVPLVHFLTAPMYLFDSRDTIDKIHEPSLEPVSRAVVQIIHSTAGVSAAQMRAGVVPSEG